MKKSFLYTRTGDEGMTSLVGGTRIPKHAARVCAYGEVDELNAQIGLVQAWCDRTQGAAEDSALLLKVSARLFDVGAHLAPPRTPDAEMPGVGTGANIAIHAHRLDARDALLPP
ncbi:MAG: ATP:cob(I)alamin adenosyltransferase, partial [Duncaniella sp.]|nr:ATP:cob(I)alamin adenosyltransferase [Duncaniella sp.]